MRGLSQAEQPIHEPDKSMPQRWRLSRRGGAGSYLVMAGLIQAYPEAYPGHPDRRRIVPS